MPNIEKLKVDLRMLGVKEGDTLMLHTSLKGLQTPGLTPDEVIQSIQEILTSKGTLLVPAFSYRDVIGDYPVFHAKKTQSCIGVVPERFRTTYAQYRSIHPTHSICAWGRFAYSLTAWHLLDHTPVGPHSPLMQLPRLSGKILMLGCGLRPNTFMHGVEEYSRATYMLAPSPVEYTITDEYGKTWKQEYFPRNYAPITLHYERLQQVLSPDELSEGHVLGGKAYLINAAAALVKGEEKIRENEYFFVERPSE